MKDKFKGGKMKNYLVVLIGIAFLFTACAQKDQRVLHSKDNNNDEEINVAAKTNVNRSDFIDELALHDAVRARDLKQVKLLLKEGSNINQKDIYGYTPLHLASRLNELEILKELIKEGASVNNDDIYEDTPLLDSTRNDYTDVSEILICNGAYRNVSDSHDMTPLHNTSKNKNLYISKMLMAEDLTPYCKKLGVKIVDLDLIKGKYRVCGNYNNDVQATNTLNIKDFAGDLVDSSESTAKWCSKFDRLKDGRYILEANAKDIYNRDALDEANMDIDDDITLMYTNRLKITIDDIDNFNPQTKLICGAVKVGNAKKVSLDLYNLTTKKLQGTYETQIKDNRWCAKVEDISYGKYAAKAKGVDKFDNTSIAIDERIVYAQPKVIKPKPAPKPAAEPERFIGLYDALIKEFKDDFGPWNAELTPDFTFRFKDPKSLFAHGNSDLKKRFTNILSDFFPRYLKIVNVYEREIKEVAIEGHTSSSYRLAKNDEERYQFNKILSQKRANAVKTYSVETAGKRSDINQEWIASTFRSYGRSYDNLIYNLDGTENASESRRVEFKIVRKENVAPVMKKVEDK